MPLASHERKTASVGSSGFPRRFACGQKPQHYGVAVLRKEVIYLLAYASGQSRLRAYDARKSRTQNRKRWFERISATLRLRACIIKLARPV